MFIIYLSFFYLLIYLFLKLYYNCFIFSKRKEKKVIQATVYLIVNSFYLNAGSSNFPYYIIFSYSISQRFCFKP